MSNRFQILLKNTQGIELSEWLRQKSIVFEGKSNLESLDNMRIFYIVNSFQPSGYLEAQGSGALARAPRAS